MSQASAIRTRHRRGSRPTSHRWARASYKPLTRISSVSLSRVWRKCQDTLSQAPIPVIPATMATQTVFPETAFLSITVTLTPGSELTSGLFILKQHLMVVHVNQLYHVQPLNQNPQDLTLPPIFYFSWHVLFPYTGKMGSDAKCLWSAGTLLSRSLFHLTLTLP